MAKRIVLAYIVESDVLTLPAMLDGKRWDERYDLGTGKVNCAVTDDVIAMLDAHNRKVATDAEALTGDAKVSKMLEAMPYKIDTETQIPPQPKRSKGKPANLARPEPVKPEKPEP